MLTTPAAALAWYLLILSPNGALERHDFGTEAACQAIRQFILTTPMKTYAGKKISRCVENTHHAPN